MLTHPLPLEGALCATARFAFVLVMLCASGPAQTQSSDDLQQCEKARELPERAIGGCTRIIDSGRLSGSNLAIAYPNRGIARTQMGEYDAAVRLNPRDVLAVNNRGLAACRT